MANTETFRQVADRFNVTKSSIHRIVSKIIDFLVKFSSRYIMWPAGSVHDARMLKKSSLYEKGVNGTLQGIFYWEIQLTPACSGW